MVRKVLAKADIVLGASEYVCAEALNAGCMSILNQQNEVLKYLQKHI